MPTLATSTKKHPTPVFFMSHGSTMMMGEDSEPARFWTSVGREAVRRGIKGIIWMGAHWEVNGDGFEVAANVGEPVKQPVAWVAQEKYVNFKINPSRELANRVCDAMNEYGIKTKLNPDIEWIHDTFLVGRWMFLDTGKSLPCTLISSNAYYDPWKILDIGSAIRKFRYEDILIIGTGGTVHNLYRNAWPNIILHRDNFAQTKPPEEWALDFRTICEDAFTKNSGPALRKAITRCMRNPLYRDAHATDDHYAPALMVAGAAGDPEDEGTPNRAMAECWELENMCNTQFQFGTWD